MMFAYTPVAMVSAVMPDPVKVGLLTPGAGWIVTGALADVSGVPTV